MTVFVAQMPRPNKNGWVPDISSASEYGKIEFVFDEHERVYALPGPSRMKARKKLQDFNPEKDYILWPSAGDPMAWTIMIDALLTFNDPAFYTQLYWDRKRERSGVREASSGHYVPKRVIRRADKEMEND